MAPPPSEWIASKAVRRLESRLRVATNGANPPGRRLVALAEAEGLTRALLDAGYALEPSAAGISWVRKDVNT